MSNILRKVITSLTIGECDGTATLARAGDVFTGFIDTDFEAWGLDQPSGPTNATKVAVYEMTKSATFPQMFGELSRNTAKLCLTQALIKRFVKDHLKHLRQDCYSTFFLFQESGKFFVARVRLCSGGPGVNVYRFEDGFKWNGALRLRVIVPQL